MKSAVFALLLVVAGAFAFPQSDVDSVNHNVVEQQILNLIRQISEGIKQLGLDPLKIESWDFEHIATSGLIEVRANVEEVTMKGGSEIDVNYLQYIPGLNRLTFDISLPELSITIGNAGLEIIFFDRRLDASLTGSLSVRGIRLAGEVNLIVNIIEGISIRSITLDLFTGRVESDLSLMANAKDLSEVLNSLLVEKIPHFLDFYKNEINRALETIVRIIVNIIL